MAVGARSIVPLRVILSMLSPELRAELKTKIEQAEHPREMAVDVMKRLDIWLEDATPEERKNRDYDVKGFFFLGVRVLCG